MPFRFLRLKTKPISWFSKFFFLFILDLVNYFFIYLWFLNKIRGDCIPQLMSLIYVQYNDMCYRYLNDSALIFAPNYSSTYFLSLYLYQTIINSLQNGSFSPLFFMISSVVIAQYWYSKNSTDFKSFHVIFLSECIHWLDFTLA